MVNINIENIIASATLSSELELEKIINTLQNCEYNPNRFPGVIFRPDDPSVVVLLFNSGKIMVTAAKSIEDVEKAIKMVEDLLNKAGLIKPIGADDDKKKRTKEKDADTESGAETHTEAGTETDTKSEETDIEEKGPEEANDDKKESDNKSNKA